MGIGRVLIARGPYRLSLVFHGKSWLWELWDGVATRKNTALCELSECSDPTSKHEHRKVQTIRSLVGFRPDLTPD
jgi:hypothetical protein